MTKLIQAVRRHPRRWGALLVLSGAALVLAGSVAKDVLLFLKQHPVESIEDTQIIRKP